MKTFSKFLYASIFLITAFTIKPTCQCGTQLTAEKLALLNKIAPCRHFFDDKLGTCMNSLEKEAFTKQFLLLDLTCKQLAELDLNENYSFMEIYEKNKSKLAEIRKKRDTAAKK
jgi:hypothetical protein